MLIPEQVAESVLQNFAKAAVNLMSMGFAIQFKSNDDVVMRIYPDIKLKSGNINLDKAKELMPDDVHNEDEYKDTFASLEKFSYTNKAVFNYGLYNADKKLIPSTITDDLIGITGSPTGEKMLDNMEKGVFDYIYTITIDEKGKKTFSRTSRNKE